MPGGVREFTQIMSSAWRAASIRGRSTKSTWSPIQPTRSETAATGLSVRDRVLTAEEIGLFWNGLDKAEISEPLRLIFRLALLTGQRRSEVAGMRKCEINHDDKLWILPGDKLENGKTIHSRTKNRREHMVPLTVAAMDVVSRAIALSRSLSSQVPYVTVALGTSMGKQCPRLCGRKGGIRCTRFAHARSPPDVADVFG